MSRGVRAIIDLSALVHNFNRVKSLVGSRKIMAMVKCNGYGHGLLPCANALSKADALGVASLNNAIILREYFQQDIVVMSGITKADEIAVCADQNILPVIHHQSQLSLLETLKKKPLTIWLKVDTGMHRLGFLPQELPHVLSTLENIKPHVRIRGLMTHLADADNQDSHFTQQQIDRFNKMCAGFDGAKSLVNSAGILKYPNAYADWVRPGIMLYGASPMSNQNGKMHGLKPVMTLQSKLIAIKEVAKGESIGYGCTWQCPETMLIGVVAIGYGDGYPRHATNGTPVLLNGKRIPLVGRVSMDMITVDLRTESQAKIGDVVTLWGDGLPIEEVAASAGTISYELFCQLTSRVEFDYV